MKAINDLKIISNDSVTKVLVNGQELHGIRELSYVHEAGNVPIVKIEIYTKAVTIDSSAYVHINNAFKK